MTHTPHLDSNPWIVFSQWLNDAIQAKAPSHDAMVLATASSDGIPSARVVLFKGFHTDSEGQGIRFFTNYESFKGRELNSNPHAALVFYWPILDRQIRVEGKVMQTSAAESDEYWNSRPRGSQLSALASSQSQEVPNREYLENRVRELSAKYEGKPVPRPDHWGGFYVIPKRFEFWISRESRLHDRWSYTLRLGAWVRVLLSP